MNTKACNESNRERVVVTLPGEFKRTKREFYDFRGMKKGYKCYPPITIVITPQSDKRNLNLFKKSLKE